MRRRCLLRALAIGFAAAVVQASASGADWRGTYEPISRACERDPIVIGTKTLRYGRCTHSIVETLANTDNQFAVIVKSKSGCGWSGTVISLTKGKGYNANGVDFHNYKSRDYWSVGSYQAYCAYGSRQ